MGKYLGLDWKSLERGRNDEGQCDTLGGVAHALTNFADGSGSSVTLVDASLTSLLTGGFAVNAHNTGDPGVYTACGNIPVGLY